MATVRKGSYGHKIAAIGSGLYRLSWSVDFKLEGSRLRHVRAYQRPTDKAGAERFAKRWGVAMPAPRIKGEAHGPE